MNKTITERLRAIVKLAQQITSEGVRVDPDYALSIEERVIEEVNGIKKSIGIEE